VGLYERKKSKAINVMLQGMALLGLSFLVLNTANWVGMAILGMLFMTLGEMLAFPFSNSYAMNRSKRGKQGAYMTLYSMSFSFAYYR